jgi:hypothetical protein
METVCAGKEWDVLLSERDRVIEGALPYLIGRKFGLRYILQPQLTQFNGPWLSEGVGEKRAGQVLADLERQLSHLHVAIYIQHFSPELSTLNYKLLSLNYKLSPRVTYRFDPIPHPDTLTSLADRGRKRGLNAVDAAYVIDKEVGASEFAYLHRSYWERRSGRDLLDEAFIQRVVGTCLDCRQGLLYGLRDGDGRLVAARFVAFDDHCAYALLSAMLPDALRNSMTRLVWALITDLYGRTDIFDFEGSMDPGIAHFYRSFGSTATTYLEVSRFRPRILRHLLILNSQLSIQNVSLPATPTD